MIFEVEELCFYFCVKERATFEFFLYIPTKLFHILRICIDIWNLFEQSLIFDLL